MPKNIPYTKIKRGTFLISTPEINSGIFFRAVVLLCEHTETGSFGIIVNKQIDLELPDDIVDTKKLANPHIGVRSGGPIQTNQMMILHTCKENKEKTIEIADGIYLGGDLKFLQDAITDPNGPEMLLCFGYSGWNAGQLEREFLDGHWFLYPADKELLFHTPADRLWQEILKKMGGKYASMSMIPEDLSLN